MCWEKVEQDINAVGISAAENQPAFRRVVVFSLFSLEIGQCSKGCPKTLFI